MLGMLKGHPVCTPKKVQLLILSRFVLLTVMDRVLRDAGRRGMSLAYPKPFPKFISASEVRKSFVDYFCKNNDHLYIRSSPVFSRMDPTLAFTNAGMNQFKDVFLGLVRPASQRVANFQKCIRVGGMHNDLEQVGRDGCHHTFFEMLGNWSFGDYFKEEACRMSWNLLTEVYGIPPERLYVTYFGGDKMLGLSEDVEVREIWRQIGVKDTHILPFGAKDNFWAGSETGPCGPCTEIHYDRRPGRSNAGNLVNSGSDEVTELWNLVFTQYDRKATGELANLKMRFVDTGMGFERLVAVLQGKTSNYDTDLFLPLFEVIRKHTGHSGYTGMYDGNSADYGYRLLADHCRMITVALSDGMIPSYERKVRTIIIKTLNVADKIFNSGSDLLKELTCRVAEILSDAYPEIGTNLTKVHYIIDTEEELVKTKREMTLSRWKKIKKLFPSISDEDVVETPHILKGLDYLNNNILRNSKTTVSSEDAFFLFDTHGVPIPTLELLASKLGLTFDVVSYFQYESFKKSADKKYLQEKYLNDRIQPSHRDILNKLTEKKVQPTSDYFKHDYRVDASRRYIIKDQETTIVAIVRGDDILDVLSAENIKDNEEIGLVLDRTHLFSEEGGQASDQGILEIEKEIIFDVTRAVKVKDFVIHFGHFRHFPSDAKVTVEDVGVIKLDEDRRLAIMKNHTALHLLNAAIRDEINVTGEKSSAVTPDNLQLHFIVYKDNLHTTEGVQKVEKYVKDFIIHGTSVNRKILSHSQFQALKDVVFIPGETILGREIPIIELNCGFKLSKEYCTGTHILNASDLQDFIILKFTRGSYGISTIKAVTGEKCSEVRRADAEMKGRWTRLEEEIAGSSRSHPKEVKNLLLKVKEMFSKVQNAEELSHITRITLMAAVKEARKNLDSFTEMTVKNFLQEEIKKAFEVSSELFVVHSVDCCWEFNPEHLETVAECFQDKPLIVFLKHQDSVSVQCIVPANFVSHKFSARQWLTDSLLPVGGLGECTLHKNPDLTYFLKNRIVTEAQLRLIINNAVEVAKKNVEHVL